MNSKTLKQCLALQDFAHEAAVALRDSLTADGKLKLTREDAQSVLSVVRAWDLVVERARIIRGRPLPGSRRPAPEKPKPRRTYSPCLMVSETPDGPMVPLSDFAAADDDQVV